MTSKIKIAIAVIAAGAVVLVVLVALGLLSGGSDDNAGTPSTSGAKGAKGGGGQSSSGAQPALRTIATKRASGPHATVAPSALVSAPRQLWLRVSAAPKQQVTGNWNVTCGKLGTSTDTFAVTPPSLLQLDLPGAKPTSCAVGSSAQLSGGGRLKVAILRDR
ncbi:MAG: hypothetical protein QOJ35_3927 [Solirubrobacteraceae bacterium]|nr:hypothetical protein [Solirubrobacteraceae bacterium]